MTISHSARRIGFACALGLYAHASASAHPGHPGHIAVLDDQSGPSASIAIRLDRLAQATDAKTALKLAADIGAAWLDLGGDAVDLLVDRGVEATNSKNLTLARDMFDRVVLIEPDYAHGWYQRALVFARKEQFIEAIRDLEEALKREPRHFLAWQALGEILESIDERAGALDAFRHALIIHPFADRAIKARDRLIPLVEGRSL